MALTPAGARKTMIHTGSKGTQEGVENLCAEQAEEQACLIKRTGNLAFEFL